MVCIRYDWSDLNSWSAHNIMYLALKIKRLSIMCL